MRYLVTGGAGFIGGHLVARLLADGHDVLVVDDFSAGNKNFGTYVNPTNGNLDVVEHNICSGLDGIFSGQEFDAVFHLAAIPEVPLSFEQPHRTCEVNEGAVVNVLQACSDAGIKRVVFASSAAVYGNPSHTPISEAAATEPMSPYGVQKLNSEEHFRLYHRSAQLGNLETVNLRLFNVYGPRQNPDSGYASLIPSVMKRLCTGQQPTIYGDGEQTRDFIFIDDVIDALIAAATTTQKKCFGQTFNIASGKPTTVNTIVNHLTNLHGEGIEPVYEPERPEPKHSHASIAKVQGRLGFSPRVKLEHGLKRTFEWYRENQE